MSLILFLIVMLCICEVYFMVLGVIFIFQKYYYYKDGNIEGTNLKGRILKKAIKHELIHIRITNMFGFTNWKIIPKIDGLACEINIDYNIMNWISLFNFLKMCIFQFIFDVIVCIVYINIVGICEYIQKYFLDFREIIGKFINNKKIN